MSDLWGVRCEIPLKELGRVRIPPYRIRFKNGWVRMAKLKDRIVCTLEDREGKALPARGQVEACAIASLMGHAIAYHLMKHNRYEPGEDPGRADLIRVSMR